RQDDSLEAAPAAETHEAGLAPAARPRSRLLLGGTAALVLCAAIAFPLALSSSSRQPPKPRPAKILESLDLPQPSCCSFGFDAAWGVGHHDDILRKIEPRTGRICAQWPVAGF